MARSSLRALTLVLVLALACPMSARAGYSFDAAPAHPDWEPGIEALQRGDWAEALERFAQVARNEPDNADVHAMLGFAYRRSGNVKAAIEQYEAALRLSPDHRFALRHAGEARLATGNRARAEQHLARLIKVCGAHCEESVALRELLGKR